MPSLNREQHWRSNLAASIEFKRLSVSNVVIETREELMKNNNSFSKLRDVAPKIGSKRPGLITMRRYSIATHHSFSSSIVPVRNSKLVNNSKNEMQAANVVVTSVPSASNTTVIETEMEELVTNLPNDSNNIMGSGGRTLLQKRKCLDSNGLAIVEKRTARTTKPTDDVDVFGNLLFLKLSKLTDESYREKTEIQLWNELMKHIENQPVKFKVLRI